MEPSKTRNKLLVDVTQTKKNLYLVQYENRSRQPTSEHGHEIATRTRPAYYC